MENTFTSIFFWIVGEYGLLTAVVVLIILLFCFINAKAMLRYIIYHLLPIIKRPLNLKKHLCFVDLEHFLNYRLYRLNIQCPIRKQLYFDIMSVRITSLSNHLRQFIQTDVNSMSPHELFYKMDEVITDSIKDANDKLISDGTPKFVIDAMDKKMEIAFEFYRNQLKTYCYNHYIYHDNTAKVWAMLDLIPVSTECYMNLLEDALAEFNGDIKALKYKGTKCIKCPVCVHDDKD